MPEAKAGARWRIALLTHSVNPRGGVVHTLALAEALHAAGHAVTVFAPATAGQRMFRSVACEVVLVPVAQALPGVAAMVASRIAAFVAHFGALLRHRHFDVFHAQDSIGGNALADLREQGLIGGFVRTVHHLDVFDDPQLTAWQHRAFAEAQRVLCVSRVWQDFLRDEHGIDAGLVPNGVDLRRYSPVPQAEDLRVALRHGLQPQAEVVLAVGGVEERKNTRRLLAAFARLRTQRPGAQLVIAGGASLLDHDAYQRGFQADLAALGLRHGAGEAVVLTGPVADADMPALFRRADAVAMPSLREGFGLVVLEALASGTPVVVSRLAPFTEYLADTAVAWADPLDVDAIARALAEALRGPGFAVPPVCRSFSWEASAAQHLAHYLNHLRHLHDIHDIHDIHPHHQQACRAPCPARCRPHPEHPMPSMHYTLRWPDLTETTCYSPSLVIKDFFAPGTAYALADFLPRIRQATQIASDRVEAKFGFACSRAHDQLADIERRAAAFDPAAPVEMIAFEDA